MHCQYITVCKVKIQSKRENYLITCLSYIFSVWGEIHSSIRGEINV